MASTLSAARPEGARGLTPSEPARWPRQYTDPGLADLLDIALRDCAEGRALRRFLDRREPISRRERLVERDAALRQALAVLAPAPTWAGCVLLLRAIERFEVILWPRLVAGGPAQDLGPMDTALLRARLAGPLPTTARHLWTVLGPAELDGDVDD